MKPQLLPILAAVFPLMIAAPCAAAAAAPAGGGAVEKSEFIYEKAPFPSCHASTIVQLTDGNLAAAWFGGSDEGNDDVGIWFARHDGNAWSPPVELATGKSDDGRRYPTWNPVLFQPKQGPLLLFYKVGPRPHNWWGMLITSDDGGKTWSQPRRLPDGILGPVRNKPVQLPDGTLLCGSSNEHQGWRVHMEWTPDLGKTWDKTGPLNDGKTLGAIQPTILTHDKDGKRLQVLCRNQRGGVVVESWSDDGGRTWGELKPVPALPNPSSGIDAVTLKDGRHLLVYNHTPRGRSPLNVAVSDDGQTWKAGPVLESTPGEYSYPAVIQAQDGKVHVTYTWKRQRIRHVVIDPAKIEPKDFPAAGAGR